MLCDETQYQIKDREKIAKQQKGVVGIKRGKKFVKAITLAHCLCLFTNKTEKA